MDLRNKTVTILGAQRTGMALARLVVRLGGKAKVSENGDEDVVSGDFRQWAKQYEVSLEFKGHTRAFVESCDFVVLSPGVPCNSQAVQWAKAKNIPVFGEIEFAFQFCTKPVIAVTGSNGKTTVVTLIHKVLEAAGFKSCLCGNIGAPFSYYALDVKDKDFIVLEISSFQLETVIEPGFLSIDGFRPCIAVILNVNQNHLDRHKDFQEYFDAKKRIFINQTSEDYAVLNFQDSGLKALSAQLRPKVKFFNDAPLSLTEIPPCSQSANNRGGRAGFHPAGETNFLARGASHNPNFAVVYQVAKILGIKDEICVKVFKNFKGVEHRMEFVRQINGVNFINDSKATTAQAAMWALERLSSKVVMICGGRDKNIDFSVVVPLARQKVKKMILIGEARSKLKKTFEGVVELGESETLLDAVLCAQKAAQKDDSVILSPMCASFDMFSNYEERGRMFKQIVNGLT